MCKLYEKNKKLFFINIESERSLVDNENLQFKFFLPKNIWFKSVKNILFKRILQLIKELKVY